MSVITKVFKWLGPLAVPLDIYDAWSDEPDTLAGDIHGSADFLSAAAGSVIGASVGIVAGKWGAVGYAYVGGEIAPEFIEGATLGTWFSIQHFFSGTSVADRTDVQGIPDLAQYMPEAVEERLIQVRAVGPPLQRSSSTILACPLGEVMVDGRCEPLN